MKLLQEVRQYLFDLRKRLFSRKRKRRPVPILPGLPEDLPREAIEEVCRTHFGGAPAAFRQQHLSGWKASGAYRIFTQLNGGREIRLIYKTAIYNEKDLPALAGLPVQPGPAEFAILSQADGPLASYLPCVYLAEEAIPGALYRYIMEDLGEEYIRALGDDRIQKAADLFPEFHEAMLRWNPRDQAGLIQYGRDFSATLQTYALPRLEKYIAQHDDPAIRELLDNWQGISSKHLDPEFFDAGTHGLIHGDPNYSNVYLHASDPKKMKLVDWEWAGFGTPYADLVSLLKGGPSYLERWAVDRMAARLKHPSAQAYRLYMWSYLERGILDAAFLSVQALITEHQTRFSLHGAVASSARRALRAYRQLL